jgi:hypothetical protein
MVLTRKGTQAVSGVGGGAGDLHVIYPALKNTRNFL